MSSPIIQIKRSQSANTPSTLANGELAYSYSSNKLFIGQTNNAIDSPTIEYIGGKLIIDKVANLELILSGSSGTNIYASNLIVENILSFADTKYEENGMLYTNGNGIVDFVTGTSGTLLQINANGTPKFDELNGGVY
jgi:hypothetical protein